MAKTAKKNPKAHSAAHAAAPEAAAAGSTAGADGAAGGAPAAINAPPSEAEGTDAAAGSKPAAADPAQRGGDDLTLFVRTKGRNPRRRAGRSFGPQETPVRLRELSQTDRAAIEGDPKLLSRVASPN